MSKLTITVREVKVATSKGALLGYEADCQVTYDPEENPKQSLLPYLEQTIPSLVSEEIERMTRWLMGMIRTIKPDAVPEGMTMDTLLFRMKSLIDASEAFPSEIATEEEEVNS